MPEYRTHQENPTTTERKTRNRWSSRPVGLFYASHSSGDIFAELVLAQKFHKASALEGTAGPAPQMCDVDVDVAALVSLDELLQNLDCPTDRSARGYHSHRGEQHVRSINAVHIREVEHEGTSVLSMRLLRWMVAVHAVEF